MLTGLVHSKNQFKKPAPKISLPPGYPPDWNPAAGNFHKIFHSCGIWLIFIRNYNPEENDPNLYIHF